MELLIRTVDKGPTEEHSKRGDVIACCPDGWAWSDAERTNPEWRIIKVPFLRTDHEAVTTPPLAGEGRWRRRFYIDLDGLSEAQTTFTRLAIAARVKRRGVV